MYSALSSKKDLAPEENEQFLIYGRRGFLIVMRNTFIRLNTGSKISQGSLPLFALNPCSEYLSDDSSSFGGV